MPSHTFFCIDAHTCGNPVRVVAGGAPHAAARADGRASGRSSCASIDWVRRALMFEPRGHDVMSGSILYPSTREDCDVGVLFIEVSGCLPMCGHGTIGTVTVAIEEGLSCRARQGRIAIETPAGRVDVEYGRTGDTSSRCGCSTSRAICTRPRCDLEVPGLGELVIDLAYGGNFYAIVEPQQNWRGLDDMSAADIQCG